MKALIWCPGTRYSHIDYIISITIALSIPLQKKKPVFLINTDFPCSFFHSLAKAYK